MATHLVPKGTMPMTSIKPGLSPAKPGDLRQPVKSIHKTKTPQWLGTLRSQGGMGYHKTFGCKYR